MYLFTRSARLAPGNVQESMAWATEMTEKVNQIADHEVRLWTTLMSPQLGRLVWSAFVEELEQLEDTNTKLAADSGYLGLTERAGSFFSADPVDDQIISLIHDARDPDRDPTYVAAVQAMAANGNFARAVEVGVKIAEEAKRISGVPTSFGIAATGSYGQVQWTTGCTSLGELQRAQEAINNDPGFLELLDTEAATAYLPGQSTQVIARRIA